MRKCRSDPMPLPFAVVMLVVGLFLGNIFTFGMRYWNARVTEEDCISVETQFLDYQKTYRSKSPLRVNEIFVYCADGNRYTIDSVSVNEQLQQKLSMLSENVPIKLLIHPNSDTIVAFSTDQHLLLDFEETINKLDTDATGFMLIGLFLYFCALTGLYYIVDHFFRKRKS